MIDIHDGGQLRRSAAKDPVEKPTKAIITFTQGGQLRILGERSGLHRLVVGRALGCGLVLGLVGPARLGLLRSRRGAQDQDGRREQRDQGQGCDHRAHDHRYPVPRDPPGPALWDSG